LEVNLTLANLDEEKVAKCKQLLSNLKQHIASGYLSPLSPSSPSTSRLGDESTTNPTRIAEESRLAPEPKQQKESNTGEADEDVNKTTEEVVDHTTSTATSNGDENAVLEDEKEEREGEKEKEKEKEKKQQSDSVLTCDSMDEVTL